MKRALVVMSVIFGISVPTIILVNKMNQQGYLVLVTTLCFTLILLFAKKVPSSIFKIGSTMLIIIQCSILFFLIRFAFYPNALVVIIPKSYSGTINVYFGIREYKELISSNGYIRAIPNSHGLLLTSTSIEDIPDRVIFGYEKDTKLHVLEESEIAFSNIGKVIIDENRSFGSLYACVRQSDICSEVLLLRNYNDSIESLIKAGIFSERIHVDNTIE